PTSLVPYHLYTQADLPSAPSHAYSGSGPYTITVIATNDQLAADPGYPSTFTEATTSFTPGGGGGGGTLPDITADALEAAATPITINAPVPAGSTLLIPLGGGPTYGSAVVAPSGTAILYTPPSDNLPAPDTFSYAIDTGGCS